jgi:hypothetical protein
MVTTRLPLLGFLLVAQCGGGSLPAGSSSSVGTDNSMKSGPTPTVPPMVAMPGSPAAGTPTVPPAPTGGGTYTLDTSNVVSEGGTLIVPHNAIVELPLALDQKTRTVSTLGPDSAAVYQSKSTCAEFSAWLPFVDQQGVITPHDLARVVTVRLTMPYLVPQDSEKRVPSTLCVGVRSSTGWTTQLVSPVLGADSATAEVTFQAPPMSDRIAILFDSTTAVASIGFDTL